MREHLNQATYYFHSSVVLKCKSQGIMGSKVDHSKYETTPRSARLQGPNNINRDQVNIHLVILKPRNELYRGRETKTVSPNGIRNGNTTFNPQLTFRVLSHLFTLISLCLLSLSCNLISLQCCLSLYLSRCKDASACCFVNSACIFLSSAVIFSFCKAASPANFSRCKDASMCCFSKSALICLSFNSDSNSNLSLV